MSALHPSAGPLASSMGQILTPFIHVNSKEGVIFFFFFGHIDSSLPFSPFHFFYVCNSGYERKAGKFMLSGEIYAFLEIQP